MMRAIVDHSRGYRTVLRLMDTWTTNICQSFLLTKIWHSEMWVRCRVVECLGQTHQIDHTAQNRFIVCLCIFIHNNLLILHSAHIYTGRAVHSILCIHLLLNGCYRMQLLFHTNYIDVAAHDSVSCVGRWCSAILLPLCRSYWCTLQ